MTPMRAWALHRVRTRLLAAFLILLVSAIALMAVGWLGMRNAQQAVAGFEGDLLPNISNALELAERTTQLAALAPKLADAGTSEAFRENTVAMDTLLSRSGCGPRTCIPRPSSDRRWRACRTKRDAT